MEAKPEKTLSARLHDGFWVAFQNRTDLVETIKEDERFYAGDQYDGPNPNNDPRITINKIQDAIRKLASKIAGTPLHLSFAASDSEYDCTALERYDEFVLAKLGHKAFSFQSVINGENLGTEITYCLYDPDAPYDVGGFYCGGLAEKHVSPLEFAVANPREGDIQKQEWVMVWHDDYVGNLARIIESDKAFAKAERDRRLEALRQEGRKLRDDSTNPDVDIINETLIRVYVRFFRIDKEVCYTLETETVSLTKYPIPLSKRVARDYARKVSEAYERYEKAKAEGKESAKEAEDRLVKDLDFDFADAIANPDLEKADAKSFGRYQEKFSLYPFAIYAPKVINNFIFGMSITKSMISIQQAINYAASLQVKHLQNLAFAKVVAKEDALGGQTWDNDPASTLVVDYSRGDSFGFTTLVPPNMSNDAYKIPEWLGEIMKDTYGFGEIMSGQISNQDMSGYLYSLALKQANSTLEQEQQLYWQYQVDLARIRLMFYKHYVSERAFTYDVDETEYDDEERARNTILAGYMEGLTIKDEDNNPISHEAIMRRFSKPSPRTRVLNFKGKNMWGIDFDVKIVAQQGLVESELNTQQWYQQMFGNGQIQQYAESPEMLSFIAETAPKGVVPEEYRSIIKHYAKRMEQNELARLRKEAQALAAENESLKAAMGMAKRTMDAERKQFGQRLDAAGRLVKNAQDQMALANRAAASKPTKIDEGETKSNNAKGIATDPRALQTEQPII